MTGSGDAAVAAVKVAMLAPIAWRTPPVHYGPWEQVTSLITEGLVALGVDVTLFATADSLTSAELDSVCAVPYAENPEMDSEPNPDVRAIRSSRSPYSPVAASVLCAVEHKTEYVAPRVMLRPRAWAPSCGRSAASTQHNVSARGVA